MPTQATAPFLQVIPQRHGQDCVVACLAMLVGVSYEAVLQAFRHNVIAQGSTIRQAQHAARRLGYPLVFSRRVGGDQLEGATGLLSLRSPQWKSDHMVLLKEDLIVDTDATIWDLDVFLAVYDATPLSLLKKRETV